MRLSWDATAAPSATMRIVAFVGTFLFVLGATPLVFREKMVAADAAMIVAGAAILCVRFVRLERRVRG